jgi:hypothetical protein
MIISKKKMNTNTSPIDFTHFDEDEMYLIDHEILEILARKIMRARDYIRSHRRELFHKNEFLAQKAVNIFFDAYVTVYINSLETLHNVNDWPKHLLEQIAKSLYRALLPIDNYSDPFRLIPNSF